ncbi:MAG: PKD domain-containing protein [Chitinophagaceae bacterium]
MDRVKLDGSASNDPDGTISSFQWTKISGSVSLTSKPISPA